MQDSQQNNKQIAKNTLLLYFRMLFMMAVSLYTSRVVLATLGVEDFGIYNVVGGIVTMFSFINSAMSSSTQRYLTFELGRGDFSQLQRVFSTSIIIHALISVIIIILAETIGLWFLYYKMNIPAIRMPAASIVYQMSILSMVVMVMSVPYNSAIIAHEKISAFAYISILEAILKLSIVFVLMFSGFDKLVLYAILMFAVQFIIRIVYGWYCKKRFNECKIILAKDWKLFKEMLAFASWSLWDYISYIAYTEGLSILLNIFFNPVINAARGLAGQVSDAVGRFYTNFQTAINPQITKSYAVGDFEYLHSLVYRSCRISFILLLMVSLPVILETEKILSIWLTTVPDYTASFVRLTFVSSFIGTLANPLGISVLATGKVKRYQTCVGITLLAILPISYIVLKLGGDPNSVYIATILINAIALYLRLAIVCPLIRLSKIKYLSNVIIRCSILGVAASIVPALLKFSLKDDFVSFFTVIAISILSVLLFSYFIGLTPNEQIAVRNKVSQKIKNIK